MNRDRRCKLSAAAAVTTTAKKTAGKASREDIQQYLISSPTVSNRLSLGRAEAACGVPTKQDIEALILRVEETHRRDLELVRADLTTLSEKVAGGRVL